MKKFFAQAYLWLLLAMLYAPIIIIAIFSFTEAKVLGNWIGFSTKLYQCYCCSLYIHKNRHAKTYTNTNIDMSPPKLFQPHLITNNLKLLASSNWTRTNLVHMLMDLGNYTDCCSRDNSIRIRTVCMCHWTNNNPHCM